MWIHCRDCGLWGNTTRELKKSKKNSRTRPAREISSYSNAHKTKCAGSRRRSFSRRSLLPLSFRRPFGAGREGEGQERRRRRRRRRREQRPPEIEKDVTSNKNALTVLRLHRRRRRRSKAAGKVQTNEKKKKTKDKKRTIGK